MKAIFIGGCHLVGKPHGVSSGFVRKIWKQWRKFEKDVHFGMIPYAVQWTALFDACLEGLKMEPDLLVLNIQSGLVLPTFERTMKRLGLINEEQTKATENWFAPIEWKSQNRGHFYWLAKRLGILILGGHREKWSRMEMQWSNLAEEFSKSRTRVIVMTPTPVNDEFFVRGMANLERVRKMVFSYDKCYEVYDAFEAVKALGDKGLWLDGQHISKEAHVLMADELWGLIYEKGEYPCSTKIEQ